jgi:hypothetical protein
MTSNLAIPGTILKGRNDSNPQRRTKVWAPHPTNPKRVLLWGKGGKFSWANVSSLDINYELAPADEPTWPDPTREPPPDPKDAPKTATPVETVAAAPEPVPTVDTSADDDQDEEPAPSPPPAPPPLAKTSAPANDDEASVTVTLAGEPARQLLSLIAHLASALRGTGARISPSSLVEDLIEREHASIVGKAVAA